MSRAEWAGTTEFISEMLSILEDEYPMTVRQLFYRLVSSGTITNSLGEYQRVLRLITKARRDESLPCILSEWNSTRLFLLLGNFRT
jgi:hypothetical protein